MSDHATPDQPWFFWELDTEPPRHDGQFPDVSETMLAIEIAHGQRLAAEPPNADDWASLPPVPSPALAAKENADDPEVDYVAACAAILQAAAYHGLHPVLVAHEALLAYRALYVDALDDARCRATNDGHDPDNGGHTDSEEGH